ncbi:hypothetical protein ACFLQS_00225 [Actinomycetota bacterium]
MAAFAVVSFFQLTFIPGFILIKFLRIKDNTPIKVIMYSFAFSLFINYLIVYHLTLTGLYAPVSAYIILAVELILIIFLALKGRLKIERTFHLEIPSGSRGLIQNIVPISTILILASSLYFFFSNLGSIFTHWDAVFSWNRWAIDWHLNDIPDLTYLYPQLIPANWSLSYILMQDHTLQFAAKSIMPLFGIFILFAFFDLYLIKKNAVFILSILFFSVLSLLYSLPYIDSGYVDFAVAFFSMAAFHAILRSNTDDHGSNNIVILSFATAAAITKQAGFIILIFSVTWLIWKIVKDRKTLTRRNAAVKILSSIFIVLLGLYWYIIKLVDIANGRDFSTLKFLLVDIHHDATLAQRLVNSLEILRASPVFFLVLMALSLFSLFIRRSRWFTLGITLPSIILWGLFFSYDDRNIIVSFPFLAYSASYGTAYLLRILKLRKLKKYLISKFPRFSIRSKVVKIRLWPGRVLFLLVFIAILASVFLVGAYGDKIKQKQIEKQKTIGNQELNQQIFDYKEKYGIEGKIITDYYWITVMPGFEGSSVRIFFENDNFVILSNSDSYELVDPISLSDEDTFGFLISDMYFKDPLLKSGFDPKIGNGEYSLLFSSNGYTFIKIN